MRKEGQFLRMFLLGNFQSKHLTRLGQGLALCACCLFGFFANAEDSVDGLLRAFAERASVCDTASAKIAGTPTFKMCNEGDNVARLSANELEAFITAGGETLPAGAVQQQEFQRAEEQRTDGAGSDLGEVHVSSPGPGSQAENLEGAAAGNRAGAVTTRNASDTFLKGAGVTDRFAKLAGNFTQVASTHYDQLRRQNANSPNSTTGASVAPWRQKQDKVLPTLTQGQFYDNYPRIMRENQIFQKKMKQATQYFGYQAYQNAATANELDNNALQMQEVKNRLRDVGINVGADGPRQARLVRASLPTAGTNVGDRSVSFNDPKSETDTNPDAEFNADSENGILGGLLSSATPGVGAEEDQTKSAEDEKAKAEGTEQPGELKSFVDEAIAKIKHNAEELEKLSGLKKSLGAKAEANVRSISSILGDSDPAEMDKAPLQLSSASRLPESPRAQSDKLQEPKRAEESDSVEDEGVNEEFKLAMRLSDPDETSEDFALFDSGTTIFKQVRDRLRLAYANGAIGP